MYEEIDLDAIESNKDEAPDYRPMLRADSGGTPVSPDISYRVRYLSTLECEEKSRYEEFAKIAQGEGMTKIAKVFRDILREEEKHAESLPEKNQTFVNLKAAIDREESKLKIIKSILSDADEDEDKGLVKKLGRMLEEEAGHVDKLKEALSNLEEEMRKKAQPGEPEKRVVCTYNVCTEQHGKDEEDVWAHSEDE
jgi:rubrerythrin